MKRFCWVGQRADDYHIFDNLIDISEICSLDESISIPEHIICYSVERFTKKRVSATSSDITQLVKFFPRLRYPHLCYQQHPPLIEFKINGQRFDLNDKYAQRTWLSENNISTPLTRLGADTFSHKARQPCIIQPRFGSRGRGVAYFDSWPEIDLSLMGFESPTDWIVSEFHPGPSLNVPFIVGNHQIILGSPSEQLLGLSSHGAPSPWYYCGNDYSAVTILPSEFLQSIRVEVKKLAQCLQCIGWRGYAGCDGIVDDQGRFWIVDLNLRFQASTLAHELLHRTQLTSTFVAAHLAAIDNSLTFSKLAQYGEYFPLIAGQNHVLYAKQPVKRILNLPNIAGWSYFDVPALNRPCFQEANLVRVIVAPDSQPFNPDLIYNCFEVISI